MKPLHSSTWRTESDCGVLVDVAEGRTTEWVPFREIVVTMDAGMTPAEARRLIVDLQHAVALAEEQPAVSEDQPKPREETCGAGVEWSDDRDQPASGDQLKPREWRKGDDEPPTEVTVLADQHGDLLTRRANGLWGWTRINGREVNDMVPSPWADLAYWRDATAEEAERGALSEVLADSEQVTR